MFEASQIVSQLFEYLHTDAVENFVSMWDFLNTRFFMHLDQENIEVVRSFKLDLIRYYLVRCHTEKKPHKILEFFGKYSHEVLAAEVGSSSSANNNEKDSFRAWYVLPYMDQPSRDPCFAPFFAPPFGEILRNGIQNYLSMVLRTCAPPKLLLVERWFRSEKQQQMRLELQASLNREDALVSDVASLDTDVARLKETIRHLLAYVVTLMGDAKMVDASAEGALSFRSVCASPARDRNRTASGSSAAGGISPALLSPAKGNSNLLDTEDELRETIQDVMVHNIELVTSVLNGLGTDGPLREDLPPAMCSTADYVVAVRQLVATLTGTP